MYNPGNMRLHVDLFIKYVSSNAYSDNNHGQPQSILTGDDSPHGGILLLLCPYVCMYVCMYVRVWLKFLVKVFG